MIVLVKYNKLTKKLIFKIIKYLRLTKKQGNYFVIPLFYLFFCLLIMKLTFRFIHKSSSIILTITKWAWINKYNLKHPC
jgi:hypothetical protein